MSLQFVRPDFVACPVCSAKPGSPALCRECLERRELYGVLRAITVRSQLPFVGTIFVKDLQVCTYCNGTPDSSCPEHGR